MCGWLHAADASADGGVGVGGGGDGDGGGGGGGGGGDGGGYILKLLGESLIPCGLRESNLIVQTARRGWP